MFELFIYLLSIEKVTMATEMIVIINCKKSEYLLFGIRHKVKEELMIRGIVDSSCAPIFQITCEAKLHIGYTCRLRIYVWF